MSDQSVTLELEEFLLLHTEEEISDLTVSEEWAAELFVLAFLEKVLKNWDYLKLKEVIPGVATD